MNPIDYANGSEPSTKFVRSYRNEAFVANGVTFLLLNRSSFCVFDIVTSIFDLVSPEQVVVLDSVSKGSFVGETSVPKLFLLSAETGDQDRLPVPNSIRDVSAGILAVGLSRGVPVNVWQAVEDQSGPTIEGMSLIGEVVRGFVPIDLPTIAGRALHLAKAKIGNPSRA
jgi:hypothetical protein